jgi:Ca2+-binding RTX toxin-like protein
MLRGVRKGGHMQTREDAVMRQSHFIAVVGAFLMGCAILLVVGGSGVQATATEEQGHSDDRCEGTRFVTRLSARYTTNDVPGCPSGGLLSGTDVDDELAGEDGDDEIRGLGAINSILGEVGNDVIYGGPGADSLGSV